MKPRLLDLFCGAGGCSVGYARAGFEVVGVDVASQPNYPYEFVQMDALELLRGGLNEGAHSGHVHAPAGQRWRQGGVVGGVHRQRDGAGATVAANVSESYRSGAAREGEAWVLSGLGRFDAIHSSPPCQAHSTLKAVTRHIDHPDLVGATRDLLERTGLPYVIENVEGAPLIEPVTLCGSSFGLDVRRHRLFETNFPVMAPGCSHGQQAPRFEVYEHGKWRLSPTVPVYGSGGRKAVEHWAAAMGIDWMDRAELTQAIPPSYTEWIGEALLAHLNARKAAA